MTFPVDRTVQDVTVLDIDPYSKESLSDPLGYAAAIRQAGRAVWVPGYEMWAVGTYDHVKAALENYKVFVSGYGTALNDNLRSKLWRAPSLLLDTDPPDHERYRGALSQAVSLLVIKKLRPELEARSIEFVDRLVAAGGFDAVKDLAEPYITRVFGDALGLPREGRENLLLYSDLAFNSFGPDNWLTQAAQQRGAHAVAWVEESCKRRTLAPGGMGAMAFASVDKGDMTEEEAERLVRSFLTAGVDTTIATIGSTIRNLADRPGQWARLHADPGLARAAFEEALRYESTAAIVYRCVETDIEFAGVQMKKGDKLMISVAGSNHDPARFGDPENFNIERPTRSAAFGVGIHACIGQIIARTEAEILLGTLARRVKELRPAGEPVRHLNNTVRGYASVPVSVVPA